MNEDFNNITYQLRETANKVDDLRKKYYEEKQSHNNTKALLNYIMRDLKEYKVPSKFHLDMTLMFDCVMIKADTTENDELELFYSLDELEEKMKDFSTFNNYGTMVTKLEELKKLYNEENE